MTAPYLVRLLCISLASFFLIHLALGVLVSLAAPAAVRAANRMRARRAARFLLVLRLLPAGAALATVAVLCVPSYLLLEPAATSEEVGLSCLGAALLCLACWSLAVARSCRAASRSLSYIRYCRMVGRRTSLGAERSPAWVVDGPAPFLALAGIVHPRLMVSKDVVAALPDEQLAVALRHEHAHQTSRDNLKRLLLLLAPDVFPFWRAFDVLERGWSRFTEWAADDDAVAGDAGRSVSLAAALVRVARMGACPQTAPLVTSLLSDNDDLAARVDRLLREAPGNAAERGKPVLAWGTALAAAGLFAGLLQPATLYSVHRLLEHLTH
ncbi:MAG TPA: hypothetical protein VGS58_19180 [Candidatus Sulfopaludibacter sp.]|nr:hypothetical protein [Candidatus Sulfopaludibacter sp.]